MKKTKNAFLKSTKNINNNNNHKNQQVNYAFRILLLTCHLVSSLYFKLCAVGSALPDLIGQEFKLRPSVLETKAPTAQLPAGSGK